MKIRICFTAFAVSFLVVFLNSCAGGPAVQNPGFDISVENRTENVIADITVDVTWQKGGASGGLYHGIHGFNFQVANKTDDIISLVWSKSSLSYNGKSYLPFIEGQKYIDSSSPQSPMVIPANGQTSVAIFSSGQPVYDSPVPGYPYSGGWRLQPINTNEVVIVLSVESNGQNYPYEIKIMQKSLNADAETPTNS
jgi:hypothetical protein